MKVNVNLVSIDAAPHEWRDGRQCMAMDYLGEWFVVRFDKRAGWYFFTTDPMEYPGQYETMTPVLIGEIKTGACRKNLGDNFYLNMHRDLTGWGFRIETGSNRLGEYSRFADGVQVCTKGRSGMDAPDYPAAKFLGDHRQLADPGATIGIWYLGASA